MRRFFRLLGSYFWWTHPRGSLQYDVMVTLILLFLFLAPYKINFKDSPEAARPHPNQIIAYPDGAGGVMYEVPAQAVAHSEQQALAQSLAQALAPVAGAVTVSRCQPLRDWKGRLIGYRVWIRRAEAGSK